MNGQATDIRWRLPPQLLAASLAEMAPDGARGCEGVALWLGYRDDAIVTVTHVVALRGPGIFKCPDYLSISAELINDVGELAGELDRYLIGQIHSHPAVAGVDLSEVDKRRGISISGYLSVVAPDFAQRPDTRLVECGVHVFDHGRWRRFTLTEMLARITVDRSLGLEALTVGGGIR